MRVSSPLPVPAATPFSGRPAHAKLWLALLSALAVVLGLVQAPAAFAAEGAVTGTFTSASGQTTGGVLYVKSGSAVTLTVTTPSSTKCVDVSGAHTGHDQSSTAKSSWTFALTAPDGDGASAVTVTATGGYNQNNKCNGSATSGQASYVRDNAGPVVTAELTPAANSAGWNKSDVSVKWTATDAGVGVAGSQPFKTDSVTSNGIHTVTAPAQADRLGNSSAVASTTVRVDKANPTITAAQTKNADGTTTITFTCADSNSGGGQASGIDSCVADGTSTNSKTVQPGVTVTGTATDRAGNTAKASSTAPAGDTTAPTLSGAPATAPNGAGWYKDDVTVKWTAADPESGIPTPPADTTIGGEGPALTSTQTVKNGANLSTTATSPAVKIDRTKPATGISGTSNVWVNDQVTVKLTPTDNLSGVASTTFSVDGGTQQTGTEISLTDEGVHTIAYFSTDNAGNVEDTRTVEVKIDRTAPTIGHSFTPADYTDSAWTNQNVTVTFDCADQGGSGLADCTGPATLNSEGTHTVPGTATDGAGNTATDSATVSIDKTAPEVSAELSSEANEAGWRNEETTVTYTASDGRSGIAVVSKPVVLGEGPGQSATGSATDAAGNTGTAGVSGVNIDLTPPQLTAEFATGWQTDDVAVTWTCTDQLSGVATGPANDSVTGEGDNLSSTASCTDKAGNVATKTVTGIKIDRTRPTTLASVSDAGASGWHTAAAEVTLKGTDSLSGIAATYYTVDGGDPQTYEGPFELTEDGEYSVTFWSVDKAGNAEQAGAPLEVRVDGTAPVTDVTNPISPASGWFVKSGIPVAFKAVDTGSGVAATYYSIDDGDAQVYGEPFTAELGTGTHTIEYWSVDIAGNTEKVRTTTVKVDLVAPTITGAQTPAANGAGWNNGPVDVKFICADEDSGINGVAGCAGDTLLTNDGAGQMVKGDAVDVAGNTSSTTYGPVNIDTTKPTLTGVPATDANGAGWYKDAVTVKWVGDDGLSGIDPATQPTASVITGEGVNLGAGPVTVADKAGNISAAASISGIKIDRTAPVVTGAPTTSPNAAGWYNGEVTVDFKCVDTLSGVASCPTSVLVKGDGASQSATSAPATDVAGNVSSGKTVGGISIDGTAPSTTSNNTCTAENDWCKGDTADIVLTAVDQTGLSGVKEIHYVVNGGAEQVVQGATTTVSVPISGSGAASLKYWSVDKAGNAESGNTVSLKWDNVAPTVTHTLSPEPNASDWNNSDVTVTFSAKDDDKGSGVQAGSLTAPVTVSTETSGRVVTGSAKDSAGNTGTDPVTVKLDKTKPTITGAVAKGTVTPSGWYSGPVTVTFTCGDALSGVATCPDPVVLSANGTNTATGTATDKAGNTATATVPDIRIDQEKPTLTPADVNVQGNVYTLGKVPTATCSATDSFSGLAALCKVTVTGGNASGVGTFNYSAFAIDKAGNSTTVTGTYRVIYRFDGFLQPINDTAHQVGVSTSIFKGGSTVPAKFQLKSADGTPVVATAAPVWLTPVKGTAMSAPVDESVYAVSADSGSTFKYDSLSRQYHYNWKAGSGGNYWRVGVKLDDGQTYYVNIGLR
jgi:hypothetical protein